MKRRPGHDRGAPGATVPSTAAAADGSGPLVLDRPVDDHADDLREGPGDGHESGTERSCPPTLSGVRGPTHHIHNRRVETAGPLPAGPAARVQGRKRTRGEWLMSGGGPCPSSAFAAVHVAIRGGEQRLEVCGRVGGVGDADGCGDNAIALGDNGGIEQRLAGALLDTGLG